MVLRLAVKRNKCAAGRVVDEADDAAVFVDLPRVVGEPAD